MKKYIITIAFETDAEQGDVETIAEDMYCQLETLEDEHGATVVRHGVNLS
jgi:hypothetical protein